MCLLAVDFAPEPWKSPSDVSRSARTGQVLSLSASSRFESMYSLCYTFESHTQRRDRVIVLFDDENSWIDPLMISSAENQIICQIRWCSFETRRIRGARSVLQNPKFHNLERYKVCRDECKDSDHHFVRSSAKHNHSVLSFAKYSEKVKIMPGTWSFFSEICRHNTRCEVEKEPQSKELMARIYTARLDHGEF